MTIPVLPIYKALAALLLEQTGKPVGLAKLTYKRDGDNKPTAEPDLPCTVLYVETGAVSGPWSDGAADASRRFRARAVGRTADQVEWLTDRIRAAVLDRDADGADWLHALEVDGIAIMGRAVDSESPIDPENERVFSRSLVIELYATPLPT